MDYMQKTVFCQEDFLFLNLTIENIITKELILRPPNISSS